jgi:hypothetical protein
LPVLHDNNSYHYNRAISAISSSSSSGTSNSNNGNPTGGGGLNLGGGPMIQLHPHHPHPAAAAIPFSPLDYASSAAAQQHQMLQPRLLDARHCDAGSKRLKNAKEQKRAQRITDLIEQLRVKMEKGGWSVSVKSKFHTLAS